MYQFTWAPRLNSGALDLQRCVRNLLIARNQNEEHDMTEKKIWLITGAGRGLGVDIAKAVLATGHAVVATGRDAAKITAAVGDHDNLLAFKLDVTRPQDAQAAVEAAVVKFGRIDVLVNNAGNFFAGFFEELSPEQVRNQIETLLFGPMNVTRAVLPVMRKQRSGLLLTISSTAGIAGQMFCTAYAAAKFGIEGWMESLTPEIAPFGIRTMLVEPGFFRTELLTNDSTTYAKPSIDDYAEKTKEIVAAWKSMDGKQGGDPVVFKNSIQVILFTHALSFGPISICGYCHCWMDEPASTASRRVSFGGESSSSGADRQSPNAIQR